MELFRPPLAVSVVIPAHNEAESLPTLLAAVCEALEPGGEEYEIVVVDDGSTDATAAILQAAAATLPVRVIQFDGNYGQSAAFEAGFRAARGDVIVTLDADGQNPPSEIPKLLAALSEADMVCGWRLNRQDTWIKKLTSKFANTVRRWMLEDGMHDTGCSLKAMRREVVERFKVFHGLHRFFPALAQMEGYRVIEVRVSHAPRMQGTSHYGFHNRLLKPLVDLLAVAWMRSRCRRWKLAVPAEASQSQPAAPAVPLRAAG